MIRACQWVGRDSEVIRTRSAARGGRHAALRDVRVGGVAVLIRTRFRRRLKHAPMRTLRGEARRLARAVYPVVTHRGDWVSHPTTAQHEGARAPLRVLLHTAGTAAAASAAPGLRRELSRRFPAAAEVPSQDPWAPWSLQLLRFGPGGGESVALLQASARRTAGGASCACNSEWRRLGELQPKKTIERSACALMHYAYAAKLARQARISHFGRKAEPRMTAKNLLKFHAKMDNEAAQSRAVTKGREMDSKRTT